MLKTFDSTSDTDDIVAALKRDGSFLFQGGVSSGALLPGILHLGEHDIEAKLGGDI